MESFERKRPSNQLRPLFAKIGVNSRASGSCYLESERLKVTCAIYGPKPNNKFEYNERAEIRCDVKFSSFSSRGGRKAPGQTDEEKDLSNLLKSTLESVVLLEKYPKSLIDVFILVIESDGSVLASSICASSLAVADANLEMKDVVTACTAAYVDDFDALLDLNEEEEKTAKAAITLAYMPNVKQVVQASTYIGAMPKKYVHVYELAMDGCEKMRDLFVPLLKSKHEK